ncbi:MAG: YgiT-type zinc finger protein [Bryobacterales bacterium]|nr:YgiT-type zinc finger protein [Bryobacterales bacterium]
MFNHQFCGGTPEFRRVTAENWWGEQLVPVENVPARVCRNCGEQWRAAPPDAGRFLEVPVYAFVG